MWSRYRGKRGKPGGMREFVGIMDRNPRKCIEKEVFRLTSGCWSETASLSVFEQF